jgi:hypothetical protein
MSKARTLASTVSTGAVLADGVVNASEIGNLTLPTGGDIVGTTATQTLTNKTIAIADNTLTGVQAALVSGTSIKTINGATVLGSGNLEVGGSTFTSKTANYTAAAGDNILANTSAGAWTLTLPVTPTTGVTVQVMDSIGTFGVYPLTVARNGSTIMSAAENMTLDVNGAATTFVYNGSTWRVI